ncbi:MAG: nucleotidyl transferase AbiEii/AbiGii toxin family protein [Microgenomates group bacterium]
MINSEEIEKKAQEFEIHSSNVQKDYIFGWLLYGLFTQSELKDQLFLKGGNALRKGYFENTRFSKDLDLGIPTDLPKEKLLSEINKICDYIATKTPIIFEKGNNKVEEKFTQTEAPLPDLKVYEARIYFKDFYGKESNMILRIGMDLTRFDKVLAPLQLVKLIHPYSDSESISCEIRCMKLEEIIATKLKCLLQRQHAPDLFDYAHSIRLLGGSLNKEEVVRLLIKKTIFDRNPHMLKDILKNISLSYFREYWDKSLICAKQMKMGVEDAIQLFLSDVDNIFDIFPDNGYRDFVFFGPELRTPIIEAARNQTLLKMKYKGTDRLVEPYSLKFLQKRDGSEREYLYVYNRSGGSSPPGLRSFVAQNVEQIENTSEKFIPREGFQIELSKAGEHPENRYLFDPNKPLRETGTSRSIWGTTQRRQRNSFGIRYVYQCGVCGKKFTKSTNSSVLGEHKNKSGFRCFNTYGIYVDIKMPSY